MVLIGDLFEKDVTRDIPPVVYFHEQAPAELEREVGEYIITGGYPRDDDRGTPDGIHEQFLRLLAGMHGELKKPGGPGLPACWISGFYGSGKSSFAKLFGLSLDGRQLQSGRLLSDALLAQDHSPDAAKLREAWAALLEGIQPMAVVFDVGSKARDDEHLHAVVVRQVQQRLGYSKTSQLVAEYELKLELEELYPSFIEKVREVHGKPWQELKDSQLVEDYFSAVLHALQPDLFTDPMSWVDSRSGSRFEGKRSADEAVEAIAAMLRERCPGRTLFIVVDEVSQYVHDNDDRMLALQSFVSALGQRMKGQAWLLATGQQKLEEGTGVATSINKLKDRFPAHLRVHLGVGNIRDVVHKRLLRKKKLLEADLKDLFETHRSDLALYAYKGDQISVTDFVEVYPMLPGHIQLLLDITTGLRSRSTRTQGDSHAIRGLLQLLGDLFREKQLAQFEVGHLITLDLIYDVLQSALDADVQLTLNRAFAFCKTLDDPLAARVVKAVALLELIQDHQKTSAELIARCLYERLGQGNQQPAVQRALDALMGESLLAYSEKTGYKIESSAGQEWQKERDAYVPGAEEVSKKVQEVLRHLVADADEPELDKKLRLPWLAYYSDHVGAKDVRVKDERKHTVVTVDFQFTKQGSGADWVRRSDEGAARERLIWVVGDYESARDAARRLARSERMVTNHERRQSSLTADQQRLLVEERNRGDAARAELTQAIQACFMAGQLYFRGRTLDPRDLGAAFKPALAAAGTRIAGELYPHPTTFTVTEKDMLYLIENAELAAPPPVFGQDRLGLLTLDAGRYEVTCNGRVPTEVLAYIKEYGGVTGSTLLAHFGAPPHGVPPDVIRATVIGLLRGGKLRIELPVVGEITSVRDEGARELLKDTGLRKAKLTVNVAEGVSPRDRNAICSMFQDCLGKDVARDNDAIADAVVQTFAGVRERLTDIGERFRRLPKDSAYPEVLTKLEHALEACRRDRRVEPTVLAVKRALPVLRDGLPLLRRMETDLGYTAIDTLRHAEDTLRYYWPGLTSFPHTDDLRTAASAIEAHLMTGHPWENTAELVPKIEALRTAYRDQRRSILDTHAARLEQIVDRLKRRDGFETLDADQRHDVLRHLRDGAAPGTDEHAIAPPLEALAPQLAARREAAETKALAALDELLAKRGEAPTVDVALDLRGREVRTEAELDRLIDELRQRILHELGAGHRVRLR